MLRRPDSDSSRSLTNAPDHDRSALGMRLDDDTVSRLRCPECSGELNQNDNRFECESCQSEYPISGGIPILIAESKSLFDITTFTDGQSTFFRPVGKLRAWVSGHLPDVSSNVAAERVFAAMLEQLLAESDQPNVLVIGGGVIGGGMQCLVDHPRIKLIESDAAIAPRTKLICDAHDLPFADHSFDAVIVQAVLEHVLDPHRCVAEIHRVLKPSGIVYSDTPFMQQVHGRQYDFTRFTQLGHRRLFRMFDELDSGISCGPGMALAWSLRYFLLSFFRGKRLRAIVSLLSRLLFFPLKYCDRYLANQRPACDAASAFYFLGRRSETPLADRDLVEGYRGGF